MSNSAAAFSTGARVRRSEKPRRPRAKVRSQRVSVAEATTLVVLAMLLIVGALSAKPHVAGATASLVVQVQNGDTLWSIARQHPIAGLSTAQTTDLIARSNHLSGGLLHIGNTLSVPGTPIRDSEVACR